MFLMFLCENNEIVGIVSKYNCGHGMIPGALPVDQGHDFWIVKGIFNCLLRFFSSYISFMMAFFSGLCDADTRKRNGMRRLVRRVHFWIGWIERFLCVSSGPSLADLFFDVSMWMFWEDVMGNKVKKKGNKSDKQSRKVDKQAASAESKGVEARLDKLEKRVDEQLAQLSDRNAALLRKTTSQLNQLSERHAALLRKNSEALAQLSERQAAALRKTSDQLKQLSDRNAAALRKKKS